MMIETLILIGAAWTFALAGILRSRRQLKALNQLPPAGGWTRDRAESVRRVLKHLQRRTIAELAEGTGAVIAGRIVALSGVAPTQAPLTGAPCIGYALHLATEDCYLPTTRWRHDHGSAAVDFLLEDETGQILVRGADIQIAVSAAPPYFLRPPLPPWLTYRHHWLRDLTQYDWVKVTEGLLQPGHRVLVCGLAVHQTSKDDSSVAYREARGKLTLVGSSTFPLAASPDEDLFEPGERPVSPEELAGALAAERRRFG